MVPELCKHLLSPASLPSPPPGARSRHLSVLSYNVLLPNSQDGWWNYKMYLPPLSPEDEQVSTWNYRRNLLRERIGIVDADVVCLQEISPISFEEDFAFMSEDLGYDGVELFRKGRFRPATFWKKDRVELSAPPVHKDRTLLTTFRVFGDEECDGDAVNHGSNGESSAKSESGSEGVAEGQASKPPSKLPMERKKEKNAEPVDNHWHILNCHLQAGKQGGRRVRQIMEGVTAVFKLAKKLKEVDPKNPKLIACGDFNGGEDCGAVRLLSDGVIGPDFIENGEPVTSKEKNLPLSSPLSDALDANGLDRNPPPTLVVPELISLMLKKVEGETPYEDPNFSRDMLDRFGRIYETLATAVPVDDNGAHLLNGEAPKMQMGKADAERWLAAINGRVGRGTEFRNAARAMGWVQPTPLELDDEAKSVAEKKAERPPIFIPDDGVLTLDGFVAVYLDELRQGKFWGIAWDLARLGEALPVRGVFEARYDRMYCSSSLRPVAVLDTISTSPCPNKYEPSDHLPIAASFRLR